MRPLGILTIGIFGIGMYLSFITLQTNLGALVWVPLNIFGIAWGTHLLTNKW
jgi:hypothetical protein